MDDERSGGCRCGQVRFTVAGAPRRTGICHCAHCRKESGSAFNFFAIWPRSAFRFDGEVATFNRQSFCPRCGSPLFSVDEEEAEIKLGALDAAPTDLPPVYELWTIRREPWLQPLAGVEQHDRDRPKTG